MRWLMGLLIALLTGCALPPKPDYDRAFWRDLTHTLEQRKTP